MKPSIAFFSGRLLVKTVLFGLTSLGLYLALFGLEQWLLPLTARGSWYFLIPVGIAFVFSYVHGSFTACFWDLLGIKARK